jgi:hypothetical protein
MTAFLNRVDRTPAAAIRPSKSAAGWLLSAAGGFRLTPSAAFETGAQAQRSRHARNSRRPAANDPGRSPAAGAPRQPAAVRPMIIAPPEALKLNCQIPALFDRFKKYPQSNYSARSVLAADQLMGQGGTEL